MIFNIFLIFITLSGCSKGCEFSYEQVDSFEIQSETCGPESVSDNFIQNSIPLIFNIHWLLDKSDLQQIEEDRLVATLKKIILTNPSQIELNYFDYDLLISSQDLSKERVQKICSVFQKHIPDSISKKVTLSHKIFSKEEEEKFLTSNWKMRDQRNIIFTLVY